MRRALMLLPLLAMAVGCEKELPQGAVKVTVSYSGFLPECVRVTAREGAGGEGAALPAQDLTGKGERGVGGSLVVAVLPPEGWGSVTVEAQAYEKACESSKLVTSQTQTVELTRGEPVETELRFVASDSDRDGYVATTTGGTDCQDSLEAVNPGAAEQCNDVDDNCSGQSDEGLGLGEACTVGNSCPGTNRCGPNGSVVCTDIPAGTMAYPDTDGDRYGDRNAAAVRFCGEVPSTHVQRNDDCDDSRNNVFPGAQELCDDRDNNCNGTQDEGYPNLNTSCSIAATQCSGQFRCAADERSTTCVPSQQATMWYRDEDGDLYGGTGNVVESCPAVPGRIAQGGDCNDGNPFIRPGLSEQCDGLDNDCSGQAEDPAVSCPAGGPTWAERTVGAADQRWHSVSSWTAGGVWAVGDNNRRAVLTPSSTSFTVLDSSAANCGSATTAWYSVWADPLDNGRAYFGSAGGRLAHQDTGDTNCSQPTTTGNLAVFGLTGIRSGGSTEFYGVSASTSAEEGAAFFWDGNNTVNFNAANNDLAFAIDIHGRTRDNLFVVGGYDGSTLSLQSPRIYRFNPGTSRWESQLPALTPGDQLKGVWVVNDRAAFAVGNAGTVFRWTNNQWAGLAFPDSDAFLSSVIAFGASSAYVTANTVSEGRIYRYDGTSWTVMERFPGIRLNDITGTSPSDLWVVGNGGRIFHWPQWPQ